MYTQSSMSAFLQLKGVKQGKQALISCQRQDRISQGTWWSVFPLPFLYQLLSPTKMIDASSYNTSHSASSPQFPRPMESATWSADFLLECDLKAVFCPFFCCRLHRRGNRWRVGGLLFQQPSANWSNALLLGLFQAQGLVYKGTGWRQGETWRPNYSNELIFCL